MKLENNLNYRAEIIKKFVSFFIYFIKKLVIYNLQPSSPLLISFNSQLIVSKIKNTFKSIQTV